MSDTIVSLLTRAADTGDPRLTAAARRILALVDDLERQFDTWMRTEQLLREAAELEARLAEIRGRLGEAGTPVNRSDNRAVREWAARNGYEVADRGRIPEAVRAAYQAAIGSAHN